MVKPIHQTPVFRATPAELYGLFMNSAKHTAATGAPATVGRTVGARWSAFGGMIEGKNLILDPHRMIVQSWRSKGWKRSDPDSTLIILFEKVPAGTRVNLVHLGLPAHDYKGVTQGWKKYYWKPWKKYLAARRRKSR